MRNIKNWLKEKLETVEYLHSTQEALKVPKSVIPDLDELTVILLYFISIACTVVCQYSNILLHAFRCS